MAEQRTREQLEEELAQALYSILANYEREGAGPGSRFEGQTCEAAQARYAVRTVLYWQQGEIGELQAAVSRVRALAEKLASQAPAGDWLVAVPATVQADVGRMFLAALDGTDQSASVASKDGTA